MSKKEGRGFFYRLFNDLFVVTINHEGTSKEFRLREIKKINNNFLQENLIQTSVSSLIQV